MLRFISKIFSKILDISEFQNSLFFQFLEISWVSKVKKILEKIYDISEKKTLKISEFQTGFLNSEMSKFYSQKFPRFSRIFPSLKIKFFFHFWYIWCKYMCIFSVYITIIYSIFN